MTSSGSRSSAPGGDGDDGEGGCRRGDPVMTSSLGVPRAPAAAETLTSLAGSEGAEPEWSRDMGGVPGYQASTCHHTPILVFSRTSGVASYGALGT